MKKAIKIMAVLMIVFLGLTACGNENRTQQGQDTEKKTESTSEGKNNNSESKKKKESKSASGSSVSGSVSTDEQLAGIHHAEIKIKDYGTIKLELDADTAPITVTNFVKLANEGFYDGLTFHRIISDFMIQGGDPKGDGTGGSEENIKGEFSENGVKNDISHKRGVISMARSTDYDSASSQFFIMHKDYPALDGQYAAFGKVTEGIEIVDKICEDVDSSDLVPEEDRPIIESIVVTD